MKIVDILKIQKLWTYPGGCESTILKINALEVFLHEYEERLVDEMVECNIRVNACDDEIKQMWWVGSRERIEMEVAYLREKYGIEFDRVMEVKSYIPHYRDMSDHCKEIYREIHGQLED